MRALPATYVEGFHDLEAVKKMKYQPLGRTGMDVSKLSFGKVVSESFNQMQKCWDTPTKNRPFSLQIAAIHTSVRYKTHALAPLHPKQEPINWWTPVQSCSSKFWASPCAASNLDRERRGAQKFVNVASHFGPLGYFLESVDVREASLPLPTHHITSDHITPHHLFLLQHPFNVIMKISLQWHDGKEKWVQVEALHDKPVAVSSLMEKFPLDFGIIVHACCANMGGRGVGGSTAIHTYNHVFYLGCIGMTAVKGMGFKQFTLG